MAGFEVAPRVVDALSFRVAVAASDVRSALGGVQSNVCIDTGDPELSGALSTFQQFWGRFTEGSAQAVDSTAGGIAAAAAAYQQVDSAVMVDPAVAGAFVDATLSGSGGTAQLLLGPVLPGTR